MTTLKQLQEQLEAKQRALHAVFAEAKTEDGGHDFTRVKCLGAEVKTSRQVVEKVRAMNAELDELGEEIGGLLEAEKAALRLAEREEAVGRPPHPRGDDAEKAGGGRSIKSLGQLVAGQKRYQDWAKSGAAGGITLNFADALPSDLLAKGMAVETLGSKALFATTAGWAPESIRLPGFVEAASRPVQLLDIIPLAQTGFEQVVYMEETTRTHAAAERAEGTAFAESTFVLTERTNPVRKITDSVPVTDEQLEDVAQAQSYLNSRLTFGLRQRLDGQVLVGDGSAPNLRGLANVSGIQTQDGTDQAIADAFFKAMTKIRVTGRAMPTHHVIHPEDWEEVRLMKTSDGLYIWGHPSEAGPERMWGLPVVQQDAAAAGTGWVGSFQPAWISLFERRGVDVQIGYVGDQFVQGRRTIRGDMRFAFVVFRPAAFCEVENLGETT